MLCYIVEMYPNVSPYHVTVCPDCGLNVGSYLRSQVLGRNITGSYSWQLDLSLARQGLLTPPTTTFQDS